MNIQREIVAHDAGNVIGPESEPQSIAIVTDAWFPQVNGVVRTISATCEVLRRWGHTVTVISPQDFLSMPAPTYPEIRLEAFLSSNYPGTKFVVGDGPARTSLELQFPDARFTGKRTGKELAGYYAGADVFVFPSKTDTFGLVMIEALACGTPVAAFPVPGPLDIVNDQVGAMSERLERAIDAARYCDRSACSDFAAGYSWEKATRQFLSGLVALQGEECIAVRSALPVSMAG